MAAIIWSADVAVPSTLTRASFFVRSTVSALTPASLSKACLTSRSQPPHVIPVTVNRICRASAILPPFSLAARFFAVGMTRPGHHDE